ncbi:helix-turn-helix domain-containing protein [Micromonospora globbae]|uniref:XRE family transcriptional regulator n=1 Tax=Micromonospora globbae TaxID=1894969 RepID=A0A420ESH9_9ACTN|nr:helix-turn-helix transcriptional regulator [Micromonospora globbae]RKF23619.1 XRE family transcriptional regulator [Micromonospora globbae]
MTEPHEVSEAWRALGRQLAASRKAAGYTQHALAPKTLSGRSTVANAEVGRQHPDRAFWERCDAVLQTGGDLAAGYDRVVALQQHHRRPKSSAALSASIASARAAVASQGHLARMGTEAARRMPDGDAAAETIIVTVVIEERVRQVRISRRALMQAMTGSLTASLPGADLAAQPVRVDPAIVEHFTVLRAVLVESDNRVGAAAILPTARQQVGHIADFRRAARGGLRDSILSTEARWAEFAGWLSDDLGDRTAGEWWLARALTMAQEAGDAELTAYVLARMSQRAAGDRDRDRVLGLACAAGRSGGNAQVRAFAAVQRAHGYAITGDSSAFRAAVEEAQRLVADVDGDGKALGSFCTTAYVWAQEGDGWLRLGRPRSAVRCFDRALEAWPESYRRERGLYLARSAAAHAAAGDPQQAAGSGLAALNLARLTRSERVLREVTAVAQQLAAFSTEPEVADLHAALATSAEPA